MQRHLWHITYHRDVPAVTADDKEPMVRNDAGKYFTAQPSPATCVLPGQTDHVDLSTRGICSWARHATMGQLSHVCTPVMRTKRIQPH